MEGRNKMELITLKDLGKSHWTLEMFKQELKTEAIKWVKDNKKCSDKNCNWILNEWIKHFFNITEEDLE